MEIITSLRTKGLTPRTPGVSRATSAASGQFSKEPYFITMAWALVPRIFAFRSCSNPLITLITTQRAITPTATPPMERTVISSVGERFCRRSSREMAITPGRIPTVSSEMPTSRGRESRRWLRAT